MNKKGFTLVELMAVLVIIGVVAVLSVVSVTTVLKSYKNTLYQKQKKSIESAARLWASDNLLILPKGNSGSCTYSGTTCNENGVELNGEYKTLVIDLQTLQTGGYISADLKSVRTKEPFNNVKISITKDGNKLTYEIEDSLYAIYNVGDRISVTLASGTQANFIVIEASGDNTQYVRAIKETSVSNGNWCGSSPCTGNTSHSLSSLNYSLATDVDYLTKDEFDSLKTNNSWIYSSSDCYWTQSTYGENSAYCVSTNGIQTADVSTSHGIRPVIRITKDNVAKITE